MTSTAPIGVFDSGLGGISVVREIRRDMPNERVLYFGDSANAPYGTKSPEQVRKLSDAIVKRFVEQGVKAVVIACNTATSAAANELRDKYDIPIIGMEPALKVACDRGHGNRQRVIVAATPLTLRERKFQNRPYDLSGTLPRFGGDRRARPTRRSRCCDAHAAPVFRPIRSVNNRLRRARMHAFRVLSRLFPRTAARHSGNHRRQRRHRAPSWRGA